MRVNYNSPLQNHQQLSLIMSQADSPSVSFSCEDSSDSCVDEIAAAAAELERQDSGDASTNLRKKAWSLCKNYLHGAWAEVTHQDIQVRQLR